MPLSIDAPIAVTGATGYVAGHVVHELLSRGACVHATARNPSDQAKVGHLLAMAQELPGTLKLFQADLLTEGAFEEAFRDCSIVIHTASPFLVGKQKDPQKTLVDPALKGTRNVLATVNQIASVQRVVLTSSVIATYGDAIDCQKRGGVIHEGHWNESSSLEHQAYGLSKTLAEKEAWNIVREQTRWDLVTINPGFVMGPSLTARNDSASIDFLLGLISGKVPGLSEFWTAWVDVRDVAVAHVEAAFRTDAEGRHLLSAESASIFDIIELLREHVSHPMKLPKLKTPKWMAYLFGPLVGFGWTEISRNVDIPVRVDNRRSIERLGIEYRPLSDTLREHVDQLVRDGLYVP